jgi:hypothetical protein
MAGQNLDWKKLDGIKYRLKKNRKQHNPDEITHRAKNRLITDGGLFVWEFGPG